MSATQRPRLVLVDGSSFLYRAHYAMPDLRTTSGAPTGAIRGVASMLRRIERRYPAAYRAVVFDAPGPTFRDELFAGYKAHRPKMPPELAAQIEPLHELIKTMGWPLLVVPGIEADDVIGTLAAQARSRALEVVIATSDKDLAQLVDAATLWVDTMRDIALDPAGVRAKFGVEPAQIPDFLALVGDEVDNIPGIAGCGPKTAAQLLARFGSLEGILNHIEELPRRLQSAFATARPWLATAKVLTTVRRDCALPLTLEALAAAQPDWSKLRAKLEALEFRALLAEYEKEQAAFLSPAASSTESAASRLFQIAASSQADEAYWETAEEAAKRRSQYQLISSDEALAALGMRLKQAAQRGELIAFDTETDQLDARHARLVGCSFAFAAGDACYVALGHRGAAAQCSLAAFRKQLGPWFADPQAPKVAHHAKFDLHVLAAHGIEVAGLVDDTLLMHYVLQSDEPHDLERLMKRALKLEPLSYEAVCGRGKQAISFAEVSLDQACRYAAEDADATLRLAALLLPKLRAEAELLRLYERIEKPLIPVLQRIEAHGVFVDAGRLEAQSRRFAAWLAELEARAQTLAGQSFNLASPKQIAELLFGKLGLKPRQKTGLGQASTSEAALQQLMEALDPYSEAYRLIEAILEHRRLAKLKNTYLDRLPQQIDERTGRIHTTFSQGLVVTGRLSSSDPNLQNIPVRTPEGRAIREAFIAAPGHLLISADYSQIELRIMAHLAQDEALIAAFQQDADVHAATAAELFGKPLEAVSADERRMAKTINFGLIYGMGAAGLGRALRIPRKAAEEFIQRYFARYLGVARYMQEARQMARACGFVRTLFGRRLWLRHIHAERAALRAADERAAINAPMQGTAADLIKLAMIDLDAALAEAGLKSRIVLQVHDELLLEAPEAELERTVELTRSVMQSVVKRHEAAFGIRNFAVPLLVEVGWGRSWAEAHA